MLHSDVTFSLDRQQSGKSGTTDLVAREEIGKQIVSGTCCSVLIALDKALKEKDGPQKQVICFQAEFKALQSPQIQGLNLCEKAIISQFQTLQDKI